MKSTWRGTITVGLLLSIAACSGAEPTIAPTALPAPSGSPQYSAILVTSDLAVGSNRVAFGLVDLNNMPVRTDQAQVQSIYFPPGQAQGEIRQTVTAEFLPWPPSGSGRGVYVTNLDFDVAGEGTAAEPGLWGLQISSVVDGGAAIEAKTAVAVREHSLAPGIGERAPASMTPTVRDTGDLSTITSARPPDPDLYQLSIDQALQTGQPLLVVFSTPAFCVSATCGPQLEMVSRSRSGIKIRPTSSMLRCLRTRI